MSGKKLGSPVGATTEEHSVVNPMFGRRAKQGPSNSASLDAVASAAPETSEPSLLDLFADNEVHETINPLNQYYGQEPSQESMEQQEENEAEQAYEKDMAKANEEDAIDFGLQRLLPNVKTGAGLGGGVGKGVGAGFIAATGQAKGTGMAKIADQVNSGKDSDVAQGIGSGAAAVTGAAVSGVSAAVDIKGMIDAGKNGLIANSAAGKDLAFEQGIDSTMSLLANSASLGGAVAELATGGLNPVSAIGNAANEAYLTAQHGKNIPGMAGFTGKTEKNLADAAQGVVEDKAEDVRALSSLNPRNWGRKIAANRSRKSAVKSSHVKYKKLRKAARNGDESAADTLDQPEWKEFESARKLKKIKGFMLGRAVGETARHGVKAAAYATDAAGTFTAAADGGATKAAGKGALASIGIGEGIESLVDRAKSVHKLRKAKNALHHSGKRNHGENYKRGIGWGIGQFFKGNIQKQQQGVATNLAHGKYDEHLQFDTPEQETINPVFAKLHGLSTDAEATEPHQGSGRVNTYKKDLYRGMVVPKDVRYASDFTDMIEGDDESISQGTQSAARQLASRSGVGPGLKDQLSAKIATIGKSSEEKEAYMDRNWWHARDRRVDGLHSFSEEQRTLELRARKRMMKKGGDIDAWNGIRF